MNIFALLVPSLFMLVATVMAIVPWGVSVGGQFVFPLLPYMVVHVFVTRAYGFVSSLLLFCCGLIVDVALDGPIGFWPLIYLIGMLVARQVPDGMGGWIARISSLLLVVFILAGAQVALASVLQLTWANWPSALLGTMVAAIPALVMDLVWRGERDGRYINVTARGSGY